jgi:sulfur carrier protein ThiS
MIEVELRLFGELRRFLKNKQIGEGRLVQVNDDSTVLDTLESVNIRVDVAKLIIVNGKPCELDFILRDGDRVAIFPVVVGG